MKRKKNTKKNKIKKNLTGGSNIFAKYVQRYSPTPSDFVNGIKVDFQTLINQLTSIDNCDFLFLQIFNLFKRTYSNINLNISLNICSVLYLLILQKNKLGNILIPENFYTTSKNRYDNIIPYRYNCITTDGKILNQYNYLNASLINFVNPFRNIKEQHLSNCYFKSEQISKIYIAAQGPKFETMFDFLKAVLNNKVSFIAQVSDIIQGEGKSFRLFIKKYTPW